MDLEKERLLAFMCAVLCISRDAYRSVRRPCRAIPVLYPCRHLYLQRVCISYGGCYMEIVALSS